MTRWGIIGTGGMAAKTVHTLQWMGADVVAVGSRQPDSARRFAADHGITHALGSHDAVPNHPDVDVVYIASTNDHHLANVLACSAAGKPILCEKPIALDRAEAEQMAAAARRAGVFFMEAMWMRFNPFIGVLDGLLNDGLIGRARHLDITFGILAEPDESRRWFNPDMGGGALVDIGVYALTLAHHLLGPPLRTLALADVTSAGVDRQTVVVSEHAEGALATITASFMVDAADEAVISGPDGRIRLHNRFHNPPRITVERMGEVIETIDTAHPGTGLQYELAEVERCLAAGLMESPIRPVSTTLEIMDWMDDIRAEAGISWGR